MFKLIVISGSPGTGKTRLAKELAKKTGFLRLDLHKHYRQVSIGYSKEKQCYDIDMKKFEKLVRQKKKGRDLIVDSHIAHLLPKGLVDLCIVLVCSDLRKLQKRLKVRGYGRKKIRENLDAEIFQVCLNEAKEKGHKVVVFDSCKDKKIAGKIIRLLKENH